MSVSAAGMYGGQGRPITIGEGPDVRLPGRGPGGANGPGVDRYDVAKRMARRLIAPAVATAFVGLAVALGWRGVDWPAQIYRIQLFRHHGWIGFDTGWYGGHYPLAYSVLFPPLAAVLGVQVLAVLSAGTAAWAFDRLVRGHFGSRAWIGSLCFAAGTTVQVAVGQLPFLFGVTFGLLAVLAYRSGHPRLAVAAALICPLGSPVAAAFLVLVAGIWVLSSPAGRRAWPAAMAVAAIIPVAVVSLMYPQSGPFPFRAVDLLLLVGACVAAAVVMPAKERSLRFGIALYAALAVVVFVIPTPLGGMMTRLGTTVGIPLIASALVSVRRRLMALVAVPLLVWQWTPAFAAITSGGADPSSHASYFAPLLAELSRVQVGPGRLEIPFTQDHWETAQVAPTVPLARGWERQLDMTHNTLFYQPGPLDPARYQAWLDDNGVSWVALPDVKLDYAAQSEGALLRAGVDYLRPVWHDPHWQLWKVVSSPGLLSGPATLTSVAPNRFSFTASQPGDVVIRVRYTSDWSIPDGTGCLDPTPQGWTMVRVTQPGPVVVTAGLLPGRDNRC
jgi:hypothetical protein